MATMKRKDFRRLRVGLVVLALCLVVSAIPFAVNMFSPKVAAVNYTVSNGNWDTLKSNIESVTNGVTGNITVTANISTGFGDPIQVKSGAIINLTVNEGITVQRTSDSGWNNINGRMFTVNSGATLNIKGKGTLKIYFNHDEQTAYDQCEYGSSSVAMIVNDGGTVNIGSANAADAPTLVAFDHLEYTGVGEKSFIGIGSTKGYGVTFNWCTAIWNKNDNSTVNMYSGMIDADCYGRGASSNDDWAGNASNGGIRTFDYCYGIYNGKVNMNGGTIDVHTNCYFSGHSLSGDNFESYVYGGGISYGILSDKINFTNGYIRTDTWADANKDKAGKKGGRLTLFSAGLAYYNTTPTVDGGTVRASTDYATLHGDLPKTRNSGPVVKTPSGYYYSPDYGIWGSNDDHKTTSENAFDVNFGSHNYGFYPSNASDLAAGTSKDSNGRTHTYGTAAGSSGMDRGVNSPGNTNAKTMLVYRYYDENGNLTSYGPNRNTSISSASTGTVATATNIAANANINNAFNPGNAANMFQYELKKVSYASYSSADGGYPATANIPLDTIYQRTNTSTIWEYRYFGAEHSSRIATTNNSTSAPQSSYIFIYLDYHKMPAEQLTFTPLANGSFTYKAAQLTAQDLQLIASANGILVGDNTFDNTTGYPQTNILNAAFNSSVTNENNFTYSFYGTRADGTTVAETDVFKKANEDGALPKDAGTWTVKYKLPANTAKNRAACEGSFTVTITKATPGFEDASFTITYGTQLSKVPLTGANRITRAANDNFLDDFNYTWANGETYLPTVAQSGSNFTVTATPKNDAVANNYSVASDNFDVAITVDPLKVDVALSDVTLTYGGKFFDTASELATYVTATPRSNNYYGVDATVSDNTPLSGDRKAELVEAIMSLVRVQSGASAAAYAPGATHAGSYSLTLSQTGGAVSGSNFTLNSVTPGSFVVNKRDISVVVGPTGSAATVVFSTDPTTGATVKQGTYIFTSTDVTGAYEGDVYGDDADLFIRNATYNYPNNGNVCENQPITLADASLVILGTKSDSYNIANVTFRTMTITQAELPSPDLPEIAVSVYDPLRTLGDVARDNASAMTNASGSFSPVNENEVPQAGVREYQFNFVPSDPNYAAQVVRVSIEITKRPVTVAGTFPAGEIVYGSLVPAASAYRWTFSNWSSNDAAYLASDGAAYLENNGGYINQVGTLAGLSANYGSYRLTSSYTEASNAGSVYTVAVDGVFDLQSANYTFPSVINGGSMTVVKRPLTIVAPDATAIYGEAPAANAAEVTYEGFVNGDDASLFTASVAQSVKFKYVKADDFTASSYVQGVDGVGEYYVFAYYDTENLTNYEIDRTSGTLTVVPKAVTLVPQDMTISYTDDAPTAFTYVPDIAGLAAGSVFTGSIHATTDYVKGADVGTYNIYTACAADGTFTAEQQPDLVVSPNYTVTLGSSALLTVQKATVPAATVQAAIDGVGTLEYVYDANTTLGQAQRAAGKDSVTFTFNGVEVSGELAFARAQDIVNVEETHGANGAPFVINFIPNGDNLNPVTVGLTGNVKVTPKQISGTLQLAGQLMVDGYVYADLSGVDPSDVDTYTYAWAFSDDPDTVITTRRNMSLSDPTYEGKELILTITVRATKENYTGSLTLTTDPISAKLPTLNADWIIKNYQVSVVYDAQNHPANVAFDNEAFASGRTETDPETPYAGEFTVKYNGETNVPVNVGTYVISYDATSDGVYASEYGTVIGTMTITARDLTVSFAVSDKVYDGTTKATFADPSAPAVISEGLCTEDEGLVELNTRNARVAFTDYNAGDAVAADLSGVYLLGEKAANYNLIEGTASARISPAPITAAVALRTPIVDYSDALADENTSGLIAYFYNITGLMSRDRSTFRIANDTTVAVQNPAAGVCDIDMDTIEAVGNNPNYTITVVTDALTITVNKIAPVTAASLGKLVMAERAYDSKGSLTNEELQAYIAGLNGGQFADEAKYYTWALVDGAAPIPEVSNTGTPKQYTVNYENTDNANYRTATLRIGVPVTPRAIVITAGVVNGANVGNGSVRYGDPVPTLGYKISDGALYEDETVASVFGAEPSVTTTYVQYSPVNNASSPYLVTVNVTQLRNPNYVISTRVGQINVTKAYVTATATAENKIYNGVSDDIVIHFSELDGVFGNDDVYLPATVTGMVANPDAGRNKTVSFTVPALQGTAAGNYTLMITNRTSLRVTIEKASLDAAGISYSFPTGGTIEFGQSVGQAILDGGSGDGTFAYVLANDVPARTGVYNNYEMRFVPTDSTNYNSVTKVVPLTVNTAYVKIEPVISGGTNVGNTLTVSIPNVPSAMLQFVTFTWYREDENGARQAIADATGSSYTLTSEDVDSRIVVVIEVSSESPYQPGESSVFEAISSYIKEVQMSFWQRIFSWWARLLKAIQTIFRGRAR